MSNRTEIKTKEELLEYPKNARFRIYDLLNDGDKHYYWLKENAGKTRDIRIAHLYTRDEVIFRMNNTGNIAASYVDEILFFRDVKEGNVYNTSANGDGWVKIIRTFDDYFVVKNEDDTYDAYGRNDASLFEDWKPMPRTIVRYVNFYEGDATPIMRETREQADRVCPPFSNKRIACHRVEFEVTDGRFDD